MSKGWRNNFLLALIAVIATGGLWLLDAQEEARNTAEKQSRAVSTLNSDNLISAEFQDEAGQKVTLSKKEQQWQITAPATLRTNRATVDKLLEIVTKTYSQKVTDQLTDPIPFGLNTPAARLTIKDQANNSLQILVGNTAPASKQRYISLGEKGPVVLMASTELSGLLQKTEALRDQHLTTLESTEISHIQLENKAGNKTVLSLDKENNWHLETPFQDQADANRLRTWLFAFTGANGTGFKTDPPVGDGDWKLTLTPTKGPAETLTIWRDPPNLLVARPGEADFMVIPTYLTEEFDKDPLQLVALRPLPDASDLTFLQIDKAGEILTAEKKATQWPRDEWHEIEEILTQDGYHGAPLLSDTPPWLQITVGKGEKARQFALHQQEKTIFITPPNRPVALELTPLQIETLQKAVATLFKPKSLPEKKTESKTTAQ